MIEFGSPICILGMQESIYKELRHHHTPIDWDRILLNSLHSETVIEMAQSIYAQIKCGDLREANQLLAKATLPS